ncbi:hypothetical protein HPB48_018594 [Haemaphysalis longicornis]|uniref:Plus3 domain-containing protein n=1 Tax=Haemaphysalis longicornis TaxID=44386 RepID=A0A9J6GVD9_HAELO|nr:hypothetical protein HPB48_018594 [Haemaphysalis longicornis]
MTKIMTLPTEMTKRTTRLVATRQNGAILPHLRPHHWKMRRRPSHKLSPRRKKSARSKIVSKAKVYTLGRSRTNKGLRLKHGKQERVFRARVVSNQDFTDSDFYKWTEGMNLAGVAFQTTKEVARKLKDVQGALNYQYKESDVETIVSEKQRFKRNPSNYAVRKTQLMKQKEITMLKGVQEEAQRLAGELEQLEERARELDKQLTSTVSAMSYINERKRLKNIVEIERAILEDAKLNKEKADDPFTRRKSAPSLVTKTRGADVTPAPVAPPPKMKQEEPVGKLGKASYTTC